MSTDTYAADPVAAFLARGGRITKCPPAYAVETKNATKRFDHSGVQKWDDLPAKERRNIRQEKAKERQDLEKVKKERQRRTAEEMRVHMQRISDIRKANLAARLADLRRQYEGGASVRDIASKESVSEKQVRKLLRKAGAVIRPAAPVFRPFTAMEFEWFDLAQKGWSHKRIADHYGRSKASVGCVLLRMAKRLKPIGGDRKLFSDSDHAEVLRMYRAGVPVETIAKRFGCRKDTIRKKLNRAGIHTGRRNTVMPQMAAE